MPETVTIRPDVDFVRQVVANGGGDLKKCFQCGTCSVVCALSPDDTPFPRQQMLAAQWGLKDRLVADPAIWWCHHCGDCTTRCPRGARPGDVFGALRAQAIAHYAWPGLFGRLAARPAGLPLLLVLPIAIFAAIAVLSWGGREAGEPLEAAAMFPLPILEALFFTVTGFVLLAFGVGLVRFVRGVAPQVPAGRIMAGLVPAFTEIATHSRFSQCTAERGRRLGHLLTFWGFMGLAFMGTVVGIGTMTGLMHTPLALSHPLKIFANLSTVVILAGCVILLADRFGDPVKRAASTYFDWFFLLTVSAVVLTGLAVQLLRLADAGTPMYAVYFVHLVLVFTLFLNAPYSKFAHIAYRTVAMAAMPRKS